MMADRYNKTFLPMRVQPIRHNGGLDQSMISSVHSDVGVANIVATTQRSTGFATADHTVEVSQFFGPDDLNMKVSVQQYSVTLDLVCRQLGHQIVVRRDALR
jgi:hypothetical protein